MGKDSRNRGGFRLLSLSEVPSPPQAPARRRRKARSPKGGPLTLHCEADVISALTNLGYKGRLAMEAVSAAKEDGHASFDDLLRASLALAKGDANKLGLRPVRANGNGNGHAPANKNSHRGFRRASKIPTEQCQCRVCRPCGRRHRKGSKYPYCTPCQRGGHHERDFRTGAAAPPPNKSEELVTVTVSVAHLDNFWAGRTPAEKAAIFSSWMAQKVDP